ncbi:MAG: SurA N-terminal domain-containing protein [Leptospirales bacterium]|nr:SurA N-terminal domain-containing protein [Leptospirales bacterium]
MKFAGYFVISFFLLIIVISFGMPDVCVRFDMPTTAIAVVNGKNIDRVDFVRFRDLLSIERNPQFDSIILDRLIVNELLWQYTQKFGFEASDERVGRVLMANFTDPNTGEYNPDALKNHLQRYHLSFPKFENMERRNIAINDFNSSIVEGTAISGSDAREEYICRNSKMQIRYAFLSKQDLMKRYTERIAVTDEEIAAEMKNNPGELKDPATDKDRIKEKLAEKKTASAEDELFGKIDSIASAGGSFAEASALLRGTAGISDIFTPGDPLKRQGGAEINLAPIENSKVFRETCVNLPIGASSEPIRTSGGIYIFTPVMKQISQKEPSEADLETLAKEMQKNRSDYVMNSMLTQFSEESKIRKNLKAD